MSLPETLVPDGGCNSYWTSEIAVRTAHHGPLVQEQSEEDRSPDSNDIWQDCQKHLLRLRREWWITPGDISAIDKALVHIAGLLWRPRPANATHAVPVFEIGAPR
jgi:hypothetical protein